jgi:hypothetical protein
LLRYGGFQEGHPAALLYEFAIARIQHRAAAGGEHRARLLGELGDHLALAPPETRFALALENQRDVGAGHALNFLVAVHEGEAQQLSQLLAHGSLARAHGSNQKNAVAAYHAAGIINKATAQGGR